jgi:hypothetical protein
VWRWEEERERKKREKRSRGEVSVFLLACVFPFFGRSRGRKKANFNSPAGGRGAPPKTPVMRRMKVDLPQPERRFVGEVKRKR